MRQPEENRHEFEERLVEMESERNRNGRIGVWIGIGAIILAVAEVAAALLSLTSDSWIVRLFR
tara:strand:+ start:324 stop:512 length:189 start_codon:yes stop_codon:yes gene_type:complete